LIIPNTGADVGTWGAVALNPDFIALDGLLGGVTTIGLSTGAVTLTAPAGVITPSAGPNQAQNAILRFTGALSGNVTVTLPLPGIQTIENLTTGNFVVSFRGVGAGQVVAIPQGAIVPIYNDGTNVRFVSGISDTPGKQEFWAGLSAMPAWVAACTIPPYLLCDGTVYNFATYPYLGARFGNMFGGNGITTFGVPDLRGRVPLAYDGTGTRITTAGSGLNGQTLGASLDQQNVTLTSAQLAVHQHAVYLKDPGHTHSYTRGVVVSYVNGASNAGAMQFGTTDTTGNSTTGITIGSVNGTANDNLTANTGGGQAHTNVQPSQVAGIWVVKSA
jgi:microcystin-dependent protein